MFLIDNLFHILCVLYLIAVIINHIDDTDETYGYYEPLHYLLFGTGMQTWEYSPHFAIRSYAFLLPFYTVGRLLEATGHPKFMIFIFIRTALASCLAYSEAKLVNSVNRAFGEYRASLMAVLMITSPGLFFCSTAFLPSAVGCSLVTLGASQLIDGNYVLTILCGCLAVMYTGWPFIGLIFFPFGLYILYARWVDSGFKGIIHIVLSGGLTFLAVFLAVFMTDSYYYGRRYK